MDTVRERLRSTIGFELYPIPLEVDILETTVSRMFMSHLYGGNVQETFPRPRKELLEIHGLDDFMYLHPHYNPHAPERPGAPGLFFATSDDELPGEWVKTQRLFVRIVSGLWQYLGQYKMRPAPLLTKEEWASQSSKVTLGSGFCAFILSESLTG